MNELGKTVSGTEFFSQREIVEPWDFTGDRVISLHR